MDNSEYTIYKAFEKKFPYHIWKIVLDEDKKQIAVELRDMQSTQAYVCVLDFNGQILLDDSPLDDKEWTLDAIRHETLVLKKVGDSLPIKEGIWLLDLHGETRYLSHQYTWLDTFSGHVKVRHRSIQSSFEEFIDIQTGKIVHAQNVDEGGRSTIKIPIPFVGKLPDHVQHIEHTDYVWLSRSGDKLLWTYHKKQGDLYQLNLCVTDASKLLYEQTLLQDMQKMIPQPYFQLGNQIFLMSYNKQEIVSYLV
ncbi:hypothetical protein [Sphingobacterium paludis]|uniref:DUF4905 domain-containing protein n=1 Tax=Sphingobacterium paludis TaxID=1476465 RepID=A0A4R7D7S6_9SPHI|nr:hypothetical protein [Sphingobacterium paludis]TDS17259.1 hypothetical protein B0I21_101121 [Sphingobacterium paludis]